MTENEQHPHLSLDFGRTGLPVVRIEFPPGWGAVQMSQQGLAAVQHFIPELWSLAWSVESQPCLDGSSDLVWKFREPLPPGCILFQIARRANRQGD